MQSRSRDEHTERAECVAKASAGVGVEGRLAADDDEAPVDYQEWLLMGISTAPPRCGAEAWPRPRVCSFNLGTGQAVD
jgi:hypothetical protein